MKRAIALYMATLFFGAFMVGAETTVDGRPALVLEGKAAKLVVDLGGGSIADFHLQGSDLNPLAWDSWSFSENPDDPPTPGPRSMGHFLCLDRWGPASAAETANGMGWHGEASRVVWKVVEKAKKKKDGIRAEMAAVLPMGGLTVERRIRLAKEAAVFVVSESVTNDKPLGRIYNMVQHPTIGPPFLDETTVVDANARKGFMQGGSLPNPEEPSVYWPQALTRDGKAVNLRHLTDDPQPNVASYVIDEEYGWTTASNATKRLLIGYIWKTEDYPWFDAWRHVADGKPFARGLEFGTSGLHQPFPILVEKGRIFGRKIFEHIDAGETQTRSYACFLLEISDGYQGVARISYRDGELTLWERDGSPEEKLVMTVGELFVD